MIGFAGCFSVDASSHGGGLALLSKTEGGIEIKDSCQIYIDFEVVDDQIGRWRYTGFYDFPERARRQESWNILQELAVTSTLL